jgi:hypothetical protein
MIPPELIHDIQMLEKEKPDFKVMAMQPGIIIGQRFHGGIAQPVTLQEYADLCVAVAREEVEDPKSFTLTFSIHSWITVQNVLAFALRTW